MLYAFFKLKYLSFSYDKVSDGVMIWVPRSPVLKIAYFGKKFKLLTFLIQTMWFHAKYSGFVLEKKILLLSTLSILAFYKVLLSWVSALITNNLDVQKTNVMEPLAIKFSRAPWFFLLITWNFERHLNFSTFPFFTPSPEFSVTKSPILACCPISVIYIWKAYGPYFLLV